MSLDCTAGIYYGISLKNLSEDKQNRLFSLLDSRDLLSENKFNKIKLKDIGFLESGNYSLILYLKNFVKEVNSSNYILNINNIEINKEEKQIFIKQLKELLSEINEVFIEPNIFLALEY